VESKPETPPPAQENDYLDSNN